MSPNTAEKLQQEPGGVVIEMPKKERQEVMTLVEQANAITIANKDDFARGGDFIKGLKTGKSKIVEFFKPMKQKAKEAHTAICDQEKAAINPIEQAERTVRRKMEDWATEEERKRREEQRLLEAKAEEDRRKEEQRLLERAAKAEDKGHTEKAEALVEQAEDTYAQPVQSSHGIAQTTRTDESTTSKKMDVEIEVENLKQFITELVTQNSNAFDALFKVGAAPLKAWVKSNGITKFPGLRIREKVGISIR